MANSNCPTFAQVVADGQVFKGGRRLIGFRLDGMPRYAAFPMGVTTIVGRDQARKRAHVLLHLLVALLRGYAVTVCDPHWKKERSLFQTLSPLASWITFASTSDEVLCIAQGFLHEFEQRKQGVLLPPRLLVFDAVSSLVSWSAPLSECVMQVVQTVSAEGSSEQVDILLADSDFIRSDDVVRLALKHTFIHTPLHGGQFGDAQHTRDFAYHVSTQGEMEYLTQPSVDAADISMVAVLLEEMGIPVLAEKSNGGE